MPEYLYKDENDHTMPVFHPMTFDGPVLCPECDSEMWRVPQPVCVVWHGDEPSKGGWHPLVKKLKEEKPALIDKFYEKREEHYRRTEHENVSDNSGEDV